MSDSQSTNPFEGVRVLELANNYAGPFAGSLLCDYGAEVVKVELPGTGDPSRSWPPSKDGHSVGWIKVNRGKKSIGLDLHDESDRAIVVRLAEQADVIVAAYRPPTLEKWGLSYEQLSRVNPRVVYVSVTGWGQTGPNASRPGFGSTADAVSGFSHIVGFADQPPVLAHFGLTDMITGLAAAFGAAMALFKRERTGVGELVDAALYEPMMHLVGDVVIDYSTTGRVRTRRGNTSGVTSPTNLYRDNEGRWLVISGSSQSMVARLFRAIGRPEMIEDQRYSTNAARLEHDEELVAQVQEWVGRHSRDEVLDLLEEAAVVSGPVNTAADIVADPHFMARSLVRGRSAFLGDLVVTGRIVQLGSLPPFEFHDAPAVGQHTDEVIADWLPANPE